MKPSRNHRPTPEELLRATYQDMQVTVARLQTRMLTIVELAGWTAKEANEILGVDYFRTEFVDHAHDATPEDHD